MLDTRLWARPPIRVSLNRSAPISTAGLIIEKPAKPDSIGLRRSGGMVLALQRGDFQIKMAVCAIDPRIDPLERGLAEAGRIQGAGADEQSDRKSTRLNSSHSGESRMPSSA